MSALVNTQSVHGDEAIIAAVDQLDEMIRETLYHAITVGGMLADKKASLAHGQFGPWIDANLSIGTRQVQKLIMLHADRALLPNATSNSHLTIDKALAHIRKAKSGPKPMPKPKPEPVALPDLSKADATALDRHKAAWEKNFEARATTRANEMLAAHTDKKLLEAARVADEAREVLATRHGLLERDEFKLLKKAIAAAATTGVVDGDDAPRLLGLTEKLETLVTPDKDSGPSWLEEARAGLVEVQRRKLRTKAGFTLDWTLKVDEGNRQTLNSKFAGIAITIQERDDDVAICVGDWTGTATTLAKAKTDAKARLKEMEV